MTRKILITALVLTTTGCAWITSKSASNEMYERAAALTKVTGMLETAIAYDDAPDNAEDMELLDAVTEHDPEMLTYFEGYQLRARQVGEHGVVVMCSEEGEEALLLDVGCTGKLDEHLWDTSEQEACEVPADATAVCPQ